MQQPWQKYSTHQPQDRTFDHDTKTQATPGNPYCNLVGSGINMLQHTILRNPWQSPPSPSTTDSKPNMYWLGPNLPRFPLPCMDSCHQQDTPQTGFNRQLSDDHNPAEYMVLHLGSMENLQCPPPPTCWQPQSPKLLTGSRNPLQTVIPTTTCHTSCPLLQTTAINTGSPSSPACTMGPKGTELFQTNSSKQHTYKPYCRPLTFIPSFTSLTSKTMISNPLGRPCYTAPVWVFFVQELA